MLANEDTLVNYLIQLKKLRRDKNRNRGAAPHKPILLLAIIKGIEKGDILSNTIVITPELVLDFKDIWTQLVTTHHKPNFALPFFHMRSEPFWKLVAKRGFKIPITSSNSMKSLNALTSSVDFAEIDQSLFELLEEPISRELIRQELLDFYFEEVGQKYLADEGSLIKDKQNQYLNEDSKSYKEQLQQIKSTLSKIEYEEEVFIRGGLFKREIPKLYNYTCAISRLRIESTINAQLVDACHIIPFSESNDDSISNGICLSPTIHRAFDRGLLTINRDFHVQLSPKVKEQNSPHSLSQFHGSQIHLPRRREHFPLEENLEWHKRVVFLSEQS